MQTIAAEASEKGVNIYGAARDVPSKAVYGEAGNRVRMDDFKGDFVLAVFWSRYCVPCIRELESLNEFARQTKNDGIRVILISPRGMAGRFCRTAPAAFPVRGAGAGNLC